MARKIAVLGTGANGSCISANLVQAGHDVTMFDQWALHVETMRAQGLRIVTNEGETHVNVRAHHLSDLASLQQTFDVVLLAVKAYDTRWAAEMIKPYLASDGLMIGVQNAMTADTIREIVGGGRTLGCVIELSSEMFTPGYVKRNTVPRKTWIGIGSLDPVTDPRLADIKELLSPVGKVEIVSDILAAKWTKLIVNAMCLGTCAIVGLPIADAVKLPGMRELVIEIGEEAVRVGEDLGHKVQPIFGLTADDLAGSNRPIERLFDKLVADVGPGRGRNSVLQDLLKGRISEVGMINGFVAEQSARRGRPAPANAHIAEITRRIEAGELKPSVGNLPRG